MFKGGRANMCVSICIIANKIDNIEKCLSSLKRFKQEIVLVDTGMGKLEDIANKYSCSYYQFDWCDDFAAARNYAIQKAKYDWIFMIDSDEYVVIGNPMYFFRNNTLTNTIGKIKRVSFTGEKTAIGKSYEVEARLFSRRYFKYTGRVHEQIIPLDSQGTNIVYQDSGLELEHTGYLDERVLLTKAQRDEQLLKQDLADKPHDAYLLFQMGKALILQPGNEKKAVLYLENAVTYQQNWQQPYMYDCITTLLIAYERLNKQDLLIETALKYTQYFANSTDYYYLVASLLQLQELYQQAILYYQKGLSISNSKYASKNRTNPETWLKITRCYAKLNDIKSTKKYCEKVFELMTIQQLEQDADQFFFAKEYLIASFFYIEELKRDSSNIRTLQNICRLCQSYIKLGNYAQALDAALIFKDDFSIQSDFLFVLGNVYLANKKLDAAKQAFEATLKYKNSANSGINSWLTQYNLGIIYEYCGDKTQAIKSYLECNDYEPAKKRLTYLENK